MSSRYTKTNVSPLQTVSMRRWKACAAFLRPKGVRRNSKRSNGVMVAALLMSAGEDCGACKLRGKVLNVWDCVFVRHGYIIQSSIVTTRSPAARALWHHMQRRRPRTVRSPDDAHFLHNVELCFGHCKFVRW